MGFRGSGAPECECIGLSYSLVFISLRGGCRVFKVPGAKKDKTETNTTVLEHGTVICFRQMNDMIRMVPQKHGVSYETLKNG